MLKRNPGFTVVVILVLGLGIGGTAAVFSVANGVLLRPLPYENPDRLVMLFHVSSSVKEAPTSGMDFLDWKQQNRSFEDMSVMRFVSGTYQYETGTERLEGLCVSNNLFGLLGLKNHAGRTFLPEETWPNQHYIILSHHVWKRWFDTDASILGKTIKLGSNDKPYTVVGVMEPNLRFLNTGWSFWNFTEVNARIDFWIPVDRDLPDIEHGGRGALNWDVVARLKPGVSVEQAQVEMGNIAQRLGQEHYADPAKAPGVKVVSLHSHLVGRTRPLILLATGAAGFVLLIACANVASLLLTRGMERQREMALRASLGAGRRRLLRQMLTESVLLAALGGAFGLIIALGMLDVFRVIAPDTIPRLEHVGLDTTTLGFALGTVLLTGISVGLVPALRTFRLDLNEALKAEGRTSSMGFGRRRLASSVVAAEVSISLILLISSGLLINSVSRLLLIDPGYRTKNILTMKIQNLRGELSPEILQHAQSLPGVHRAALAYGLPLCGDVGGSGVKPKNGDERQQVYARIVTPGYFELMQMPLLAGRDFTDRDNSDSVPVTIVNESMARCFWPDEDPIGKRFKYDWVGREVEIVGIVRDTKNRALDASPEELEAFLPLRQKGPRSLRLIVSTGSYPKSLIGPLRNAIWAVDRNAVIGEIQTMEEIVAGTLAVRRFLTFVLSFFSLVALILAICGIYGLFSHTVRQRTHEVGVRMALGARDTDVLNMLLGQVLRLILIGITIGLVGALTLTRVLSSFLYNISSTDPYTFACVSLLLAGVALLAGYIPARRAARIDPMEALRYE
jgi:putative ABC transport system permease protein